MAGSRWDAFTAPELTGLFDSIEIAEWEAGSHPPDDLTRELIGVMQARGIGDREELVSMLLELDDRAKALERPVRMPPPGTPVTFRTK